MIAAAGPRSARSSNMARTRLIRSSPSRAGTRSTWSSMTTKDARRTRRIKATSIQQAAVVFDADGRRVLADSPRDWQDARHASLRDRPIHADHDQRFGLAVMLLCVAWGAERFGTTDYGRIFMVASAAFGTLLTTFVIAINNHSDRGRQRRGMSRRGVSDLVRRPPRNGGGFAIVGFSAAFTVINELPACSRFSVCSGSRFLVLLAARDLARVDAGRAAEVAVGVLRERRTPRMGPGCRSYGQRRRTTIGIAYEDLARRQVRPSYWNDRLSAEQSRSRRSRSENLCAACRLTSAITGFSFSLSPIWLLTVPGMVMLFPGRTPGSLGRLAAFIATLSLVCPRVLLAPD